jgi:colanic acid/amylovoran biosynthesis glycosyltransferase
VSQATSTRRGRPETIGQDQLEEHLPSASEGSLSIAILVLRFPVVSEAFILDLITGLMDRGHHVDIYAIDGETREGGCVHSEVAKYRLLDRTHAAPDKPESRLRRAAKAVPLLFRTWRHAGTVAKTLNFVRYGRLSLSLSLFYAALPLLGARQYDIVHCQFGTVGLVALGLRELGVLRGRLVTTFRGFDISKFVESRGERVYDRLFAGGDLMLANCRHFRDELLRLGCPPERVRINRSGIDCSRFPFRTHETRANARPRILTVGRLVEKKGIEYAIRAVAKLHDQGCDLEYEIIGDGPLRATLQTLIRDLGVAGIVSLPGGKDRNGVIHSLQRADVFLAPSVRAEDGDEDGPANVLKEAMATGLPVVATQHGGIPELVQDGVSGFLVPERDADTLAERLAYLIDHPDAWGSMGRAGRAFVEQHFEKNVVLDELVDFYQQTLFKETS